MARIGEQQIRKVITFPELSKQQLHELDRELEPYMIEKERGGKIEHYVTTEGYEKFYFDKGAVTKDFSVKDIMRFREVQNQLEQYHHWLGRKEYAIKMQGQDYEKQLGEIGKLPEF